MAAALDDEQIDTLLFIAQYQRMNQGISPTLAEIGREYGISRVSALGRIRTLTKRGVIVTRARIKRSITFTLQGKRAVAVADRIENQRSEEA